MLLLKSDAVVKHEHDLNTMIEFYDAIYSN